MQSAYELYEWGRHNFGRFDVTGDRRLNAGELDTGIRTSQNPEDRRNLSAILRNYEQLKKQNSDLFGHHDSISIDDLQKNYQIENERYQQREAQRQADARLAQQQAESRQLMTGLLQTDSGMAQHSLFGVIDGMRGNPDDKVGRRDLDRYLNEFDRRARHGDVGAGHFSPETRQYVQYLRDNWDASNVVALRGTYERDGNTYANDNITLESLRNAAGMSRGADPFAPYRIRRGR